MRASSGFARVVAEDAFFRALWLASFAFRPVRRWFAFPAGTSAFVPDACLRTCVQLDLCGNVPYAARMSHSC